MAVVRSTLFTLLVSLLRKRKKLVRDGEEALSRPQSSPHPSAQREREDDWL
jgi:hypothetical protein